MSFRRNSQHILVLRERQTMMTFSCVLHRKKAEHTAQTLGLKTFFCDPYASWQKGGVENTNGRLTRDLPRSNDLLSIQKEDFDETIDNLDSTPRKALGWMTPQEAFSLQLNRVALQT